jgi:hypothetical protein
MTEPMTEEQFRKTIFEKYKDHFEHIYTLHQLAQSAMQAYRHWTQSHYEMSLSLIFGRAYKSYDSIRRLCEIASCEDAGVLVRCLLNLLAVTRWISQGPTKRAKRYFDWYWISLKADAERFPDRVPRSWIPTIQKHFEAVKSQFEYRDKKNRPKFAKHWYEPEAPSIQDLFKQVDLTKHYEEAYRPLSSIEHSDINAFFAMTAEIDKSSDERRLEIQSDVFVPHYLRNAFQYFAEIFGICNKTIPLADSAKLKEITQAGIGFYADDMKRRGMELY